MGDFRDLLAPLKDLASNWELDIDDLLNNYSKELEKARFTADGGQANLNFAEAALLIQGSTNIYSKKVEYLHQLVLQALESISQQRAATAAAKNSAAEGGPGQKVQGGNAAYSALDDEKFLFGADPEYLLLDDGIEEGSNINLVNKHMPGSRRESFKGPRRSRSSSVRRLKT